MQPAWRMLNMNTKICGVFNALLKSKYSKYLYTHTHTFIFHICFHVGRFYSGLTFMLLGRECELQMEAAIERTAMKLTTSTTTHLWCVEYSTCESIKGAGKWANKWHWQWRLWDCGIVGRVCGGFILACLPACPNPVESASGRSFREAAAQQSQQSSVVTAVAAVNTLGLSGNTRNTRRTRIPANCLRILPSSVGQRGQISQQARMCQKKKWIKS